MLPLLHLSRLGISRQSCLKSCFPRQYPSKLGTRTKSLTMSAPSSSSLGGQPSSKRRSVSLDSRDYDQSPFKPAPLRLQQKVRPTTPKIAGEPGFARAGDIEPVTPSSHLFRQIDGQTWSALKERRQTAPRLAGLVSKFEVLDAMTGSNARPGQSSSLPLNPSKLGIMSSLGHTAGKNGHHKTEDAKTTVGWRATIEGPLLGQTQVQLSSDQAVSFFLEVEKPSEQGLPCTDTAPTLYPDAIDDNSPSSVPD